MGRPRRPRPVKLIVGLLAGDPDLLRRARQLLTQPYGGVDLESEVWPFDQTEYYTEEMGPGLKRQFLSFERLIRADDIAEIKLRANALEERIAEDCALSGCSRPVNIDPGYIDLARLVLATTKDRSHRIYVGSGIYAEVTLQYTRGAWQVLPWTYPDYRGAEYHAFFDRVRERLRIQWQELDDLAERTNPQGP